MFGLHMGRMGGTGRVGAIVASMPSGAMGIWYADQYDAASNAVPNSAGAPAALSMNRLRGSRRLFTNNAYWGQLNCTKTDLAEVAPDGSTSAATIVGAGNWVLPLLALGSLPAGTYTIAATVKRNTGSDQVFAFTKDFTGTKSPTKTATDAWQRFSYTFTSASPIAQGNIGLCSIDNATSANLQVDNVEIYLGASDLGPAPVDDGNLYLGQIASAASPSVAANVIDLTGQGFGSIHLPASSAANVTMMAVLSKTASGSVYDGFLSSAADFNALTAMVDQSGVPATAIGGVSNYGVAALWSLIGQGYHLLTHRFNGAERQLWIDDVCLFRQVASVSAFALSDLFMGVVSSYSLYSGCKVNSLALYDRALSDAEVRTSYAALSAKATANGLTMAPARVLVQEGDSITAASGAPKSYSYRYGVNQSPKVVGKNIATGGSGIADCVARAALLDATLPPDQGTRKFILSVAIGTNDLMVLGVNPFLTALAAYLDARRAAGWYAVAVTLLPSTRAAGFNADRVLVNAELRLWLTSGSVVPGKHIDALVDFDTHATMGADATATNVTYYPDGLHPSDAGHALLEPVYTAVINGIAP